MRVRATVAYDGTGYSGFQRQLNATTVQEVLETVLAQLTQEEVTLVAAGRTDAGVHALGQVIAFDTRWQHGTADLQRAMNAVLPPDIAVRDVAETGEDFHPRYDARKRHYRYSVRNAPLRWPIGRQYSLHVPYALDERLMQEAAQLLVGEHDFATFGQPTQGDVTLRHVFKASWSREPFQWESSRQSGDRRGLLVFDIEANGFLYRMVRSIVGTLLDVGQHRMSLTAFEEAFASCERSCAGKTAEPHGLCLMRVYF